MKKCCIAFTMVFALSASTRAEVSYTIKMQGVSGGAGIPLQWNCTRNNGNGSYTTNLKDGPFTVWRDGTAVATVYNSKNWRDYDVAVGSSYVYHVTGYGVSSGGQTKICDLDYISSVERLSIFFGEKGGSTAITASAYKRERVPYVEDGTLHYRIDSTRAGFDIERSDTWITKSSYSSANALLTVTVSENTSEDPRSGTITLTDGMKRTYTIVVTQAANDSSIYVNPDGKREIPIPKSWIATMADSFLSEFDGNYETAANADAANGMKVWACYVAGLDPTDPDSHFEAKIEIKNGLPVITWEPNLNEEGETRIYTIYGNETLDANGWMSPTNSLHRFFKVGVEMP